MHNEILIAVLISFGLSVILCPVIIPFLKKLKFDHIFFSFWNLRILKNSKQAVGGPHRMRIFVLNFLIYYTFFFRHRMQKL